jgi:hypothetical protein
MLRAQTTCGDHHHDHYTIHADFENTWRHHALNDLVAKCLKTSVACGVPRDNALSQRRLNPLGRGWTRRRP